MNFNLKRFAGWRIRGTPGAQNMATPIIPPTPPIIAPRGRRSSILCCSASQE
jgi:hypothetical protein